MYLIIADWWGALGTPEKIYWGIALVSTLFFVIQVIMTFVGIESSIEADPTEALEGFSLFSIRSILGFTVFFGWGGVAALSQNFSPQKALMVAFLAGFLAMVGIAYTFSQVLKLQESGTIRMDQALGCIGEVYIPILANRASQGEILLKVANKTMQFSAITDEPTDLSTGTLVVVVDVMDDNIMLVLRNNESLNS